jgi:hypothetical protein
MSLRKINSNLISDTETLKIGFNSMDASYDEFTKQFVRWFANKLNIRILTGGWAVY